MVDLGQQIESLYIVIFDCKITCNYPTWFRLAFALQKKWCQMNYYFLSKFTGSPGKLPESSG